MRNVVLIEPEDCGRDFAPYGYSVASPHIERLAREGLTFRRAFCESPQCSPSRASMLTGTPSYQNGMFFVSHRGFDLHDPTRHLASWLGVRGYETVLAGQQHESCNVRRGVSREEDAQAILGYNRVLKARHLPEDDRIDHGRTKLDFASARAAADFLREPHDRPFFLSVGLWNAHRPFPDARAHGVDPDRVRPPAPIPDTPHSRETIGGYHALLGYVDQCVGIVMDALADSGRLDDTLVILTVDHGPPLRAMKTTLYDAGLGVALIMRFPERYRRGETTDALVSHLDVFPTLCEYLALDPPDWLVGQSFMPACRGETDEGDESIFASHHYAGDLARYDIKRSIRTDRYKLIRLLPDPQASDFEQAVKTETLISGRPTEDWPETERRLHALSEGDLLFDLALDPSERVNVAHRPGYAEVRRDLGARLDAWMTRTDDPALRGQVPPPPGANSSNRRSE